VNIGILRIYLNTKPKFYYAELGSVFLFLREKEGGKDE